MAVPIPEAVVAEIAAIVEPIRTPGSPGAAVRWVRMGGLHVTLRFLGPTEPARIPALIDACRAVAVRGTPFRVELAGAGAFPNPNRPRTIWLGIREGAAGLAALTIDLGAALAAAGWPADDRPFRPHLTLARSDGLAAGPAAARSLAAAMADREFQFDAERIVLFESQTGGGPARYLVRDAASLSG